jgi:signal transduction histidine kinase
MDITTLLLIGGIAALLVIGGFFGLIWLALLTYVVKNLYPLTRRTALWAAKIQNFLPLLILDVALIILIVVVFVFALRLPTAIMLLLILLGLILVVALALVALLVELAILVYIVRIVRWVYGRWRGLLGGLLPQVLKLKIKHDVGKDKDVTTHFAELKAKLGKEADQARRNISKLGK